MRAKKAANYVLSFVLCCFIFLLLPMKAQAGMQTQNWKEVTTWNELTDELIRETSQVKYIKVTKDIDVTTPHTGDLLRYWDYADGLFLVRGDIYLDLNGKKISYKWCARQSGCLFLLTANTHLSILDSSSKKDGMIYFNGWAEEWDHGGFGLSKVEQEVDGYLYDPEQKNKSQRRDVFFVSDTASLTLNAGVIRAGRGERQWVTNVGKYDGKETGGRHTGWAWMIINGSAVIVDKGGSFIMNGGRLDANGLSYYSTDVRTKVSDHDWTMYLEKMSASCVSFVVGAKVVINDGYLVGSNNAGYVNQISGLTVKSGNFEANGENHIILTRIKGYGIENGYHKYGLYEGMVGGVETSADVLRSRIELDYLDKAAMNIERKSDWHYLCSPKMSIGAALVDSNHIGEMSFDFVAGMKDVLTMEQNGKMISPYFDQGDYGTALHSIAYTWYYREEGNNTEYQYILQSSKPTITLDSLAAYAKWETGKTYYVMGQANEIWNSTSSYSILTSCDPLKVRFLDEASLPKQQVKSLTLRSTKSETPAGYVVFDAAESVSECSFSWYENGLNMVSEYGTAWKTIPFKSNSTYTAYVYFRMSPGYYCTDTTTVSLGNTIPLEVISLSEDGKQLTAKVVITQPCRHETLEKWEMLDETFDIQKCTICGKTVNMEEHAWEYVSGSGAAARYKCNVCNSTRTMGEGSSKVYSVYLKLGYCFVGETMQRELVPLAKLDRDRITIYRFAISEASTGIVKETGSRYENKNYQLKAYLKPKSGYAFSDTNLSMFCDINGHGESADSIVFERENGVEFLVVTFTITPVTAPSVEIQIPSDIVAGDDLVKRSTETGVKYNGRTCDNIMTILSADGEMLLMNFYQDGKWSSADLDAMIAEYGSSLSAAELKEAREMYTAKAGVSYTVTTLSLDTDTIQVHSTLASKITVIGGDHAVSVTRGEDNSFSCQAVYVPQGGMVGDINLFIKPPVKGEKPSMSSGVTWRSLDRYSVVETNFTKPFSCDKTYTVMFMVTADYNQHFTKDTIATVNGFPATVNILNDSHMEVSYTFPTLPHREATHLYTPSCTESGCDYVYCKDCGKMLGSFVYHEATGHNYTSIEAVEPTCISVGNVAYQVCEYCGDIICDRASVYLPPDYSNHVGGDIYYEMSSHWVLCACGKRLFEDRHNYNDNDYCEECGCLDGMTMISQQPQDVQASAGDTISFHVDSSFSVTYQWEKSTDGGVTWVKSSSAGSTTDTLTMTVEESYHNWKFRCKLTSVYGPSTAYSEVASIFVFGAGPAITSQPENVTVQEGKTAVFTVTASGTGLLYKWERCTSGTKWETITGTTNSRSVSATKEMNGWKFRVTITDTHGKMSTSNPATLTVIDAEGLAITKQPANVNAAAGETATFSVTAVGEGLTYQWEYKNASATTWSKSGAAAAKTANMTFTVGTDKTLNGRQYRCVVSDKNGNSVTSNAATLTVGNGPVITAQPANQTATAGATVSFKVAATGEGLTYQWEYKNASAATWSKSGAAVAKTANMTFTVGTDKTLNGRQYRCIVTDKNGKSVTSNAATLTVSAGPVITSQPANVTAAVNDKVTFSVKATGEGLTYQWQYKNASATTWSNSGAAAAKTANMTFSITTDKSLNGRQYRCVVSDKNGNSVTSNAATLTVGTAAAGPAITSQPANVTAAVNDKVTFSVIATGEGLTYQWQYKNAGASDWSNSGAAAAKTANMTFTVGTDKTLNGRQYRCIVTDKNGSKVTSNAATLTVSTAAAGPAITSQPANVTAAVGASVSFKVTATGESLTYQWQYKNAGASTWSNSGAAAAKTANMTFTVGTDKTLNGRQYRCVVTDKNGNKVTSNAATLTVSAGPAITSQPANVTAAVNDKVTFSVTATGEGLTYQWQYKNASASTWSNSGAAAAKTANMTFTVGTDKTLNGRQYRCVVTDKNGNTVTSNAATLTVK